MRKVCRAGYADMSDSAVIEAIRVAGPAKVVARALACSPRTIERWRSGEAEPPAGALIRLMAWSRGAAGVVLRHIGLDELQMDAEEAELLGRLAELRARRRDAEKGSGESLALRVAAGALDRAAKLRREAQK